MPTYIGDYEYWDISRESKYEEREAKKALLYLEQKRERKRQMLLPPPPVQLTLPFEDAPGEKGTSGRVA
jgi:hypothetical protein